MIPMQTDERLNTITHLIGLLLAVAGSIVLLNKAAASDDAWKIVSFSVFAAAMVLLYAASTLFHSASGPMKAVWARLDHCAIYLLIAGTYTPLTLITLRGPIGWGLAAAIWTMALFGISRELWFRRQGPPSVVLYVVMGWIGLAAAIPIAQRLPVDGIFWLLLGAGLYTLGIVFYAKDARWRHAHGVWHLFVLGGTVSHYIVFLTFVA
jgi:hemolysin III